MDGLELYTNASTMLNVVWIGAPATLDVRISNCLIRGGPNTGDGSAIVAIDDGVVRVSNCIVWDHGWRGVRSSGFSSAALTIYCYNVTCCDCATVTGAEGAFDRDGSAVFVVKNCIGQNPNTSLAASAAHFQGTFSSAEYNLSGDTTAPGTNSRTSKTVTFVAAGSDNFLLSPSDTEAKDFGKDLSGDANLAFSDDIIGTARPQGASWDMGASEAVVAAAGFTVFLVQGSGARAVPRIPGHELSALGLPPSPAVTSLLAGDPTVPGASRYGRPEVLLLLPSLQAPPPTDTSMGSDLAVFRSASSKAMAREESPLFGLQAAIPVTLFVSDRLRAAIRRDLPAEEPSVFSVSVPPPATSFPPDVLESRLARREGSSLPSPDPVFGVPAFPPASSSSPAVLEHRTPKTEKSSMPPPDQEALNNEPFVEAVPDPVSVTPRKKQTIFGIGPDDPPRQ